MCELPDLVDLVILRMRAQLNQVPPGTESTAVRAQLIVEGHRFEQVRRPRLLSRSHILVEGLRVVGH